MKSLGMNTLLLKKIELGKAAVSSKVNTEMIAASGKIQVEVILELCQHVSNNKNSR